MEPGDLLDLEITDVAHGGVFVSRYDGRVVFVPDAIPGERVRVRLTDLAHAAFWRGEAVEILDASPHRRRHVWAAADIDTPPQDRPGGADFGHIDVAHQRDLKLQVVRDALGRIGGIDLPVTIEPPAARDAEHDETPDGTGWRTRVSLHVDDAGRVGPFAARSHRVITVADLPLATPAVEHAATQLTGRKPGRLDLVQPADGGVRIISRPHTPRGRRRPHTSHAPGREVVIERAAGRDFRVDAGGFWQVHRLAAVALTDAVTAAIEDRVDPDASHLDLYGGVGLLAAAVAQRGGDGIRITSVESDARATAHATENLAEWGGARAETGRVDTWLQRLRSEASAADRVRYAGGIVVLDPPRSGAGRDVVESVVDLHPATIVYVACDPVALSRDLATFRAGGYETPRVDAIDLFPNSHHVEAIAVLTPAIP